MAIPQLRAEGVDQTGGSTAFTINFTGFTFAAGDILEISLATDGWVPVLTTANGWALAQDPLGNTASVTTNGGAAGAGQCGMFVYWKTATGSTATTDPPPVFQAPSSQSGTVWALEPNSYSGARSGNPWHKIATSILTTAATAITSDAQTSALANCLFMTRVAGGGIDDSSFPNWAMSGSSGPSGAQVSSGWHGASGNKVTFTGTDGGYATAGGPHNGTCSFATAAKQARISLIMASVAEPAGVTANAAVLGDAGATSSSVTHPVTASSAALGAPGATAIAAAVKSTLNAAVLGGEGSMSGATVPSAQLNAAIQGAPGTLALSGTIPVTINAAAVGNPGSIAATATAPGVGGPLSIGKFGIKQKANTTTTASPLTTFAVYPAWQASHLYTLSDAIRVTNGGNIYELTFPSTRSSGTSAASGGPTGTGAGIVDGSPTTGCVWNYLGPGTGACDTQATGSFIIASVAWGRDATGGAVPTDNKGNTLSLIAKHFYASFPASSQATYAAAQPASGGTGHTLTAAYGAGNDGGLDECTAIIGEIKGGTILKDHSYVENNPVSNVVTSAPVTTTGPAVLVAFWWLNGVVRASGTNHDAIPGSGFTAIPEATALMEIGPSGAGEVQVATHFRQVASAGTYTASITTTGGEGAAVHLLAIQANDPPPPATATAAVRGEAGAVAATATAAVRATVAAQGAAGTIAAAAAVDHQVVAALAGGAGAVASSVTVAGGAAPATATATLLGAPGSTAIGVAVAAGLSAAPAGAPGQVTSSVAVAQQATAALIGAPGVTASTVAVKVAASIAAAGQPGTTSINASLNAGPRIDAAIQGGAGSVTAAAAAAAAVAIALVGAEGQLAAAATVQAGIEAEEPTTFAELVSAMDDVILSLLE